MFKKWVPCDLTPERGRSCRNGLQSYLKDKAQGSGSGVILFEEPCAGLDLQSRKHHFMESLCGDRHSPFMSSPSCRRQRDTTFISAARYIRVLEDHSGKRSAERTLGGHCRATSKAETHTRWYFSTISHVQTS